MAKKKPTKKTSRKDELTHLQKRFVQFILKGNNQKDAYLKAGYKARGKTAYENASRLARKAKVKKAIQKGQEKANRAAEITQKRILEEYGKIAFFTIKQIYDENGKLKPVKDMDDATAAVIAAIDISHKHTHSGEIEILKKIKAYDKIKALDSLARTQGMFNDKLNLGMNSETLNAILSGLPEEYATAVREALGKLVSYRRG
jgi:phage terminase small subunit